MGAKNGRTADKPVGACASDGRSEPLICFSPLGTAPRRMQNLYEVRLDGGMTHGVLSPLFHTLEIRCSVPDVDACNLGAGALLRTSWGGPLSHTLQCTPESESP